MVNKYLFGGEGMKVAIVHDWLVTVAGSERVLEQIVSLYPRADIFSLVDFLPEQERSIILNKNVKTSFVQKLPLAKKHYRWYLPLFPYAIERLDVSDYDLVISSSHAVAKGAVTNPRQLHICYCHTPMRYAWDLQQQYLKEAGLDAGLKGFLAKTILSYIRKWDVLSAPRVDYFIANSYYIADRIKRAYGRDAVVIYPPVDVEGFGLCTEKEDFYLAASRMVPYKKMDLIVEAFSAMPDKRLVVIGDGPDFEKVKARAGSNIELIGYQPFPVLRDHLQRAKAFIFAAEEDFGILPVESQACGTPVIAFGRGGVLETVRNIELGVWSEKAAPTGVFFYEQTMESLRGAVILFEKNQNKFDGQQIRKNAIKFGRDRFQREFKDFVAVKMAERP
jgi:glycosyltransferase involved in cell wall biosynthesis